MDVGEGALGEDGAETDCMGGEVNDLVKVGSFGRGGSGEDCLDFTREILGGFAEVAKHVDGGV